MKLLNTLTISEVKEGLLKKEFTVKQVVQACFDQIDKYDNKVKAFITVCKEEALKHADECDFKLADYGAKVFEEQPLFGIPYACKDNFNTQGVQTTAGAAILRGYISPYDSTVTKRLKQAGAILLGKTNMDAFAHGSSTETSDYFKTTNPWDFSRVPGGSSGGSAAAVAADMCIFATGSETAGSIRGPAAWCGVTGIKPTYGRVSRYGVIAMASSTDSPGPLAKNVEDCALVLEVIAGKDPLDATSSPKEKSHYSKELTMDLHGVTLGLPKSYFSIALEKGVRDAVIQAVEIYKKLGAKVIDVDLLDTKYTIAVYTVLQRSEVSSNLARFDGIRFGKERLTFGFEAKKRQMLGAYALSAGYYDQYYAKAQKVRTLIIEDFNKAFEKVDALISPTMPCIALKMGESEKSVMFGEMMDVLAEPSAIAGLTSISVPCGLSQKMPVGFQLIGPMFSESKMLAYANEFQKVTNFHKERTNLCQATKD